MIRQKTDVRNVINALNELEKLKLLLFDDDQYILFEHIPKPFLMNLEKGQKDQSSNSKQVKASLNKLRQTKTQIPESSRKLQDEEARPKTQENIPDLVEDFDSDTSPSSSDSEEETAYKNVLMTANNFWDSKDIPEEKKIDKFCDALENMARKRKEGNLNIIDERLIEILRIYEV